MKNSILTIIGRDFPLLSSAIGRNYGLSWVIFSCFWPSLTPPLIEPGRNEFTIVFIIVFYACFHNSFLIFFLQLQSDLMKKETFVRGFNFDIARTNARSFVVRRSIRGSIRHALGKINEIRHFQIIRPRFSITGSLRGSVNLSRCYKRVWAANDASF